jgi:hypothetical protein
MTQLKSDRLLDISDILDRINGNSERQKIVREIRKKYKGRKLPIQFYQEVAEAFGGRCLSTAYKDSNDDLEFKCKRNHVWAAVGASISQGNWCGQC